MAGLNRDLVKGVLSQSSFDTQTAGAFVQKLTDEADAEQTRANGSAVKYDEWVESIWTLRSGWTTIVTGDALGLATDIEFEANSHSGVRKTKSQTLNTTIVGAEGGATNGSATAQATFSTDSEGANGTLNTTVGGAFDLEREDNGESEGSYEVDSYADHHGKMSTATATSGANLQSYRVATADEDLVRGLSEEVNRNLYHQQVTVGSAGSVTGTNLANLNLTTGLAGSLISTTGALVTALSGFQISSGDASADLGHDTTKASNKQGRLSFSAEAAFGAALTVDEAIYASEAAAIEVEWVDKVTAAWRELHIANYTQAAQTTFDNAKAIADSERTDALKAANVTRVTNIGDDLITRSTDLGQALKTVVEDDNAAIGLAFSLLYTEMLHAWAQYVMHENYHPPGVLASFNPHVTWNAPRIMRRWATERQNGFSTRPVTIFREGTTR